MLSVVIQPRFRQRQPVGGVTPNESRKRSNKIIGLAGSRSPEIAPDSLLVFAIARPLVMQNHFDSQSFFYFFLQCDAIGGAPLPTGSCR